MQVCAYVHNVHYVWLDTYTYTVLACLMWITSVYVIHYNRSGCLAQVLVFIVVLAIISTIFNKSMQFLFKKRRLQLKLFKNNNSEHQQTRVTAGEMNRERCFKNLQRPFVWVKATDKGMSYETVAVHVATCVWPWLGLLCSIGTQHLFLTDSYLHHRPW